MPDFFLLQIWLVLFTNNNLIWDGAIIVSKEMEMKGKRGEEMRVKEGTVSRIAPTVCLASCLES